MQRRDILRGGAAAGVGAVGGTLSACVGGGSPLPSSTPEPGLPPPPDMDVFCAELEAKLAGISKSEFVNGFVTRLGKTQLTPEKRAHIQAREELFRRSLRSLYLSQTFRDLPPESQANPRLQELMQRHVPEMDQTVFDVTDMLERLPQAEREATRRELERRPQLGIQIAETIDEHAAAAGVSVRRRREVRAMLTQSSFRLRHAAPGALIDEYVSKVRRATATDGAERALALNAASQASAELFFAGPGAASSDAASPAPAASWTSPKAKRQARTTNALKAQPPDGTHPGTGTIRTGAWLLGIGVLTFGVSAGLVSIGATPLLIGMTVGALMFAIGLIVLIVGALIYVAS